MSQFGVSRLLAAAAVALALLAPSAHAAELRYAHVGAEGDIQTRYAAEAAEAIAKATNGEVTLKVFPASQLGGVSEMVDGVKMGSISMGHHDFASLARIVPEVAVFNAPFIYRDGAHALAATDPASSAALQAVNEKLIEKGGMRIIGRIYRGDRHISSNFPVKSPEDLQGKPFRVLVMKKMINFNF